MQENSAPIAADAPIDPDDVYSGQFLGGMLSLFFFYTILSSLYVLWWTWKAIESSQFQ